MSKLWLVKLMYIRPKLRFKPGHLVWKGNTLCIIQAIAYLGRTDKLFTYELSCLDRAESICTSFEPVFFVGETPKIYIDKGYPMYIKTTPATQTDPEDRELIQEVGEAHELFTKAMYDIQEPLEILMAIDDYSEYEEIELNIVDYFSTDLQDLPWGKREVTKEEILGCAQ